MWAPSSCERADPLMLPMTWNAACLLIFHTMNKDHVDSESRIYAWDSVDFIMECLHKFAEHWNLARILLRKFDCRLVQTIETDAEVQDSLEDLRAKSWRKLGTATIFGMLWTLSTPQTQSKLPLTITSGPPTITATLLPPDEPDIQDLEAWSALTFGLPYTDSSNPIDWLSIAPESENPTWHS